MSEIGKRYRVVRINNGSRPIWSGPLRSQLERYVGRVGTVDIEEVKGLRLDFGDGDTMFFSHEELEEVTG